MIALLSIVAAGMSVSMRNEIRLAGNLVAAAQARHAAEAGVQLALSDLLGESEERGVADGRCRYANFQSAARKYA